jgi:hypothetical protein
MSILKSLLTASPEHPEKKIVLIGASNLNECVPFFGNAGYKAVNLTTPGCTASPENVAKIMEKVEQVEVIANSTFVFDLYGNSVFRYHEIVSMEINA